MPNSSPFQTNRSARASDLITCFRHMGKARMYLGAVHNDSPTFNFNESYNNQDLVQRRGKVTEGCIQHQAEESLAEAKKSFRKACHVCEFREQGAGHYCGDRAAKEALFWEIYNSPEKRKRFYRRIKSAASTSGEQALPCIIGIRPGQLKKSDWVQ